MSSTVNESMPTSTTQNCTKTLYLIRHGQSLANRDLAETIEYQDAGLTDQGITQARGLQQHLETLDLELVVVSPLTRALQTCDSALPASYSGVVIVHPKIHEICDSYYSCGQKRAIIRRDFAKFDWSHVPENNVWWWPFDEHGKSEPTESAHERIYLRVKNKFVL
ncbi:unnamed protein product [Rotaria sordida]|uniref:Phosphoglycerate mutase-like protein n=1 Tax=Rotaria sordida TaxID=392033 RepID=A0A815JRI9_9BILA|nr:unnamed protein product [Rotaria sordida]